MRLDPRHLPYKHRLQLAIHQYLTLPALVVVLATGFYQVADVDFDVGGFWLGGTLTIVLVLGGMLGAYIIPEDRRLEAMVERDIAASGSGEVVLPAEYQRRVRIEAALGGFASLLVFVAVYLTVTKPGL
jgi:uncharacterized membrane protein